MYRRCCWKRWCRACTSKGTLFSNNGSLSSFGISCAAPQWTPASAQDVSFVNHGLVSGRLLVISLLMPVHNHYLRAEFIIFSPHSRPRLYWTSKRTFGRPKPILYQISSANVRFYIPSDLQTMVSNVICTWCMLTVRSCNDPSQHMHWTKMVDVKTRILDYSLHPTTPLGVRIASIKFLQRVILVHTKGASDPRVSLSPLPIAS